MTWQEHFEWKGERRRKRHYRIAVEKRMVKHGDWRRQAVAKVKRGVRSLDPKGGKNGAPTA